MTDTEKVIRARQEVVLLEGGYFRRTAPLIACEPKWRLATRVAALHLRHDLSAWKPRSVAREQLPSRLSGTELFAPQPKPALPPSAE